MRVTETILLKSTRAARGLLPWNTVWVLVSHSNVGLALVRRGTIMRCSGNPIGDPPLFRVVLNYAMFAGRG